MSSFEIFRLSERAPFLVPLLGPPAPRFNYLQLFFFSHFYNTDEKLFYLVPVVFCSFSRRFKSLRHPPISPHMLMCTSVSTLRPETKHFSRILRVLSPFPPPLLGNSRQLFPPLASRFTYLLSLSWASNFFLVPFPFDLFSVLPRRLVIAPPSLLNKVSFFCSCLWLSRLTELNSTFFLVCLLPLDVLLTDFLPSTFPAKCWGEKMTACPPVFEVLYCT